MTARKSADPQEKKYKIQSKTKTSSEPSSKPVEQKEKVPLDINTEVMQKMLSLKPSEATRRDIYMLMQQTFNHRRKWILISCLCLKEIVKLYPRMLDFNGDLVNL